MKDLWAYKSINNFLEYTVIYNTSGTTHLRTMLLKLLENVHCWDYSYI